MKLPRFSDSGGVHYTLPLKPPFYFEGMTTRVFPLRARRTAVQNFVDAHVNIIPPELGRFRAFSPYVLLMMIDYGKLALALANTGWLAQREVLFGIPLEWYRSVDGRWVFHDWAFVTPFIFVDSDVSLSLGRTVVGWPKLLGWLTPTTNVWMEDPRAPIAVATVSTMVYPKTYAGSQQERRVFLEVLRRTPSAPLQIPPDIDSPFAPWMAMRSIAEGWAGLSRDLATVLAGLSAASGSPARNPENAGRMFEKLTSVMTPGGPSPYFHTLNLKQFRDASSPTNYCYQSLTSGRIALHGFNAGGPLTNSSFLAFDPSGGYSVHIARWPSLPIVDTLGLEAAREWRGDGVDMVEVRPVFPFWYDADMGYERADNIAWRGPDQIWRDQGGVPYRHERNGLDDARYNTSLGNTLQSVAGPLKFTESTMRVLPLLAARQKLETFLEGYLNDPLNRNTPAPAGVRFELWGPEGSEHAYVYLVATSYGGMTATQNNIGSSPSQAVMFLVPVRWRERTREGFRFRGLGFVPVFNFMDNHTAVISASEVQGIPTVKGTFVSPPNTWMIDSSGKQGHAVLTVACEVLASFDVGEEVRNRVILEVRRGEMLEAKDSTLSRVIQERWAPVLIAELERKKQTKARAEKQLRAARALALEVLARHTPWSVFTLKQFRDAHEPESACYQSLEMLPRFIEHVHAIHEIEEPFHVRIHEYPSQPIVDLLGLVATQAPDQTGGIVYLARPVRPFAVRISWNQELARRLWYRCGSDAWSGAPYEGGYFAGDPSRSLSVGESLGDVIDDGAPSRLREKTGTWAEEWSDRLTLADAMDAVERLDLQVIIESILSREWERPEDDARWARYRSGLAHALGERLSGVPYVERPREEVRFFREAFDAFRLNPHRRKLIEAKLSFIEVIADSHAKIEMAASRPSPENAPELLATSIEALLRMRVETRIDALRLQTLQRRVQKTLGGRAPRAFFDESAVDTTQLRTLVALVRGAHEEQREAVFLKLSKAAQKPDYCLPRGCLGEDRERLFPRHECWDSDWFVGSNVNPSGVRPPLPNTEE